MENPILLEIPKTKVGVFDKLDFEKNHDSFHKMYHKEPHTIRRQLILTKYPQVKELFQTDSSSFYIALLVILSQLTIAYYVRNASWLVYLICLYVVGATLSHTLQILVHDLTHYTCFKSINLNRFAAILCNVPTGIPSAITFGRYHKDHHMFMNQHKMDPDLPTDWEIRFFVTTLRKLFFLIFLPFFYAIRPYFINPKVLNMYEVLNYIVIFSLDYMFVKYFGWSFMLYLIIASLIGMGFHPVGMHVIAEHYEFVKGQETYSYYGILNVPNLNVGYHTEHHDFPTIPWRLLPKLREMAPEFYENLPKHESYVAVGFKYLFDHNIGPWSRIIRIQKEE